ncbi:hint-domain-domain-containing protein [Catenaria anguillulae PL171]|uniref:Hint-domain-domain-containing protein n=1 Tax=Catenaria anguillulae PL171 TaxID=765915 RepID=A0A1Y2HC18_9FUNG|nr:hint-domain-domain-containing protein [Catenaria anguillulae PL171]
MSVSDLVPNRDLRHLIESSLGATPSAPPSVQPTAAAVAIALPTDEVVRVTAEQDGDRLWVRIHPENSQTRSPVDLVCVIDISGSMGTEAVIKTAAGVENNGLSILDVVKHALKTIIASLGPNDTLSLVTFESKAQVLRARVATTDANKPSLIQSVDSMRPMDMTNLWDGMKKGLGIFAGHQDEGNSEQRVPAMFILTDGQPNIAPPRGHCEAIKRYTAEHGVRCTLNTFGFGYSLDSELLHDLAKLGDGLYSFIPDAGMVGTVFVHALANTCATMCTDVAFKIGNQEHRIGTIQYGQTRDVVVDRSNAAAAGEHIQQVDVSYVPWWTNSKHTLQVAVGPVSDKNKHELEAQHLRQKAAEAMRIQDLLTDLTGQGVLAFEPEHFARWGKHYLPSLGRSHLLQQCNNFKDPGVQHYGGPLFNTLRDKMDRIFDDLPPAVPSIRQYVDRRTNTVRASAPVSMASYNSRADPCFGGDCLIAMADGSTKKVGHVRKGDLVKTEQGAALVECVLKTVKPDPSLLVRLGNLAITPWHPVKHHGKWAFPYDVASAAAHAREWPGMEQSVVPVYSLLLQQHHTVIIDGWVCVTLGHGLVHDPVCGHPFFAGNEVRECLEKMKGFEDGLVLTSGVERDSKTGLVCGFAPLDEE